MLGYYNDPSATREASLNGWFRTGDLGVVHSDGYLELRDRLKDVIISGGENIPSIELEQVIASHRSVLECAVMAASDPKWGEAPVAFVTLRAGSVATADELIEHVRGKLAHFKAPQRTYLVISQRPRPARSKIRST